MRILSTLFFALAAPVASAAAAPDDVIVVSATRSEIPVADAIVPVTVIRREQIEQAAASDIAELLRFEAGLDIGRNGGPGQSTSLFLRGTESNHTLVLIDGVRINPGTIGGAALQHIAPEVIERIEIVKGGRSSLYGTDAIGGVINVVTRRAGDGYAELGSGVGSFATRSGYLSLGSAGPPGELGATVNWQRTDGYAIRSDSDLRRGYENLTANLYGTLRLGAATVGLRHWRAGGTVEYLDFLLAPAAQDYRNQASAVELARPLGARASSTLLVSRIVDDIEQRDSDDFVTSERLAVDWQFSADAGAHALAAGLFVSDERARALSFGSGFDETTATRALFLRDSVSLAHQRLFLAARYTDHETFGGEFTWNAEYALDVGERLSLVAGLGHAYRAPDATDRFGFGGNPALRPEVSDEALLGARLALSSRQTLALELYRNDIADLIDFDLATFTLENLRRAEIRGAELDWTLNGERYALRASLLLQRAEEATDGSRLLRRPERSLTINATRDLGRHRLGLSLLASGARQDFATTLPGYVLLNATGQFKLGSRWQIHARIENLLDTDYRTAEPYRMPARSGYLEFKYRWQ